MKGIKRLIAFVLCFCIISSCTVVSAAGMGDVNGDGKILTNDAISVLGVLQVILIYLLDKDTEQILTVMVFFQQKTL